MSLFGMSLFGSGLPAVGMGVGEVIGAVVIGGLFPGRQGLTAVDGVPPGRVAGVGVEFETLAVEELRPADEVLALFVPVLVAVVLLVPPLFGLVLLSHGTATVVDAPGLVACGVVAVTAPGLPATLPALPATAGVPGVTAGAPWVAAGSPWVLHRQAWADARRPVATFAPLAWRGVPSLGEKPATEASAPFCQPDRFSHFAPFTYLPPSGL